MYFYQAYNLIIQSELRLPELLPIEAIKADVLIRRGRIDEPCLEGASTGMVFRLTSCTAVLFWEMIGTFLVLNGNEIIIEALPNVHTSLIRLPLLGLVMATLLSQRELCVLHASAVTLRDGAVAFLGNKGWGKSTMVAALYLRGHSLISDDAVALEINHSDNPMLLPAFPRLKLWPDAAASLGENPATLPKLSVYSEKRERQIDYRFTKEPVVLRAIYVLARGSRLLIEPLPPQDAMAHLIRNMYVSRFGDQLTKSGNTEHFFQCASLVKQVPIYRLQRPGSLQLLPAIAQFVEEHNRNQHFCQDRSKNER